MVRSARRVSLLGCLAFALFACESKEAAPVPAPEKVNEAKHEAPVASAEAKPERKAEAKPESSASDKPEAKPEEKAEAKAENAAPEKAEAKPDEKTKAEAKAPADAPKGSGESLVPAPKNGILGKAAADKIVKVGERPVVHLLSAGAEPRAVVAYALAKGQAKPFRMGMDLEMAMKTAGMTLPPTKVPHMGMLFDFTTGDRKDKDWPIEGKVSEITVDSNSPQDEQITKALRQQLEPMKGFSMTYLLDPQGRVHDLKLSWPDEMPAQAQQMMAGMSQSLESMTSPLPTEPIGAGAKWEVVGRAAANGADLLQVSTFSLKEQKGDVLKLDVSVRQLAADEKVMPPGMPEAAKAKLVSFESKGSGKTLIHLKDVAPTDGSLGLSTSMSIEIALTMAGKTQTEKTSIDTKTKVTYARPAK